jgi:hypothetical protein
VPLQIYDPGTTAANPDYNPGEPVTLDNLQYNRSTFPNRVIPVSRLDPVAMKMASYIPLPNTDVGPFFQNNYFTVSPETNTANGVLAKLDHSIGDKHRISASVSTTNGFAGAAHYFDNAADPGAPDRQYTNRRITIEHALTLSPGSVNTATFEYDGDVSSNSTPSFNPASELGLTGADGEIFPRVALDPYLPLGRYNGNTRAARNVFTFTDAHALKLGRHSLRFTAQYQRQQLNTFQPATPAGSLGFDAYYTDLPGIVNTGAAFESFLLGAVDWGQMDNVTAPSYFRTSRIQFSASDTWEPRAGLTLSAGLTYQNAAPRTERYDRQSTVDLNAINPGTNTPGALIFAGQGGAPSGFQPRIQRADVRLGAAWSPSGDRKSVARASFSRSYQMPPLNSAQWGTQGFNGAQSFVANNSELAPAFFLGQGIPAGNALPDLSGAAANGTNAALMDRSGRVPVYQSGNLSFEREVPAQVVVTAGAGAASGHDLFVGSYAAQPNAISPDNLKYGVLLNDLDFRNALRPYPQYLDFDVSNLYPAGNYFRESFWVRVEKRSSGGFTVNATYEFARQWDDYSGPYGKQDYFNARNEWALSPWNTPQHLSINLSYDLPFGANKPFLNFRDWRRHLVDSWSVSDTSTIQDGTPLAPHPLFNNTGGVINSLHVDTVAGVSPKVSNPSPAQWYNPAAFDQPADFTLGDAPRTIGSILNPGLQNHDLSLAKRFAIDQERTMEFTASAFNVMNHGTWNNPDPNIGSAAAPNVNAGKIIGSRGGRVIQLGLRLSF